MIAIELGGDDLINEGTVGLLRLPEIIAADKMHKPSFMMVLCGVVPLYTNVMRVCL